MEGKRGCGVTPATSFSSQRVCLQKAGEVPRTGTGTQLGWSKHKCLISE